MCNKNITLHNCVYSRIVYSVSNTIKEEFLVFVVWAEYQIVMYTVAETYKNPMPLLLILFSFIL